MGGKETIGLDNKPTRCHFCVMLYFLLYKLLNMFRATMCPKHIEQLIKEKIKNYTKVTSSWFVIHTELRCTVNHISDRQ